MGSSQKFIARNRAPRVQIEYDVETYGAQKKVNLPFIVGVMSDLAGKSQSEEAQKVLADRKFLEVDVDNFDARMKSMKPRVAFNVPNTLTGEGNMAVDVTFESMEDFSPAAVARKVEPLRQLLDARNQLANLLTYMDGKVKAEELVAGCTAAIGWGIDVVPVPAGSMVQGLAALAVHDPGRQAVDDGYTMARAAAGARHGSVRVATERALTWAGTCEPGDGLGIAGDEVLVVGPDVGAAAAGVTPRIVSTSWCALS